MSDTIALKGFTVSPLASGRVVEVKLNGQLSEEERLHTERLRQRDAEVSRHARVQVQAAGHHALGEPRYVYQVGPDGWRYAVDGEAPLDLQPTVADPKATIQKAEQVRLAALSPSDLDARNWRVAREARQLARQALRELAQARMDGQAGMDADPARLHSGQIEALI